MNERFDIAVVGGGITGLTAAALLAQSAQADGLNITVIDAAGRTAWNEDDELSLRVSAIAGGSADLLKEIGAWSTIENARHCPYDHMRVWDERDNAESSATLCFDADEFAVPQLGYIVENKLLQHALLRVLDTLDVELRFAAAIVDIEVVGQRHVLHLLDGETVSADLVVGADGARSMVREAAGIELQRNDYEQVAVVTHLLPEKDHRHTAWQRFLRDGPLGMLPLADGRISVVWTTTPETAAEAIAGSDAELGELLTAASDHVLGRLTVKGARGSFPLAAQHANDYVRRGIALIGDAAHTVHPLAGQGANLGLQDAAELAAVVVAAIANGEHPADRPVLRRYERARKGANVTMMHFMTGLNRLFAADSSILRELRRTGMQLFNRSGPIRERMVGVALGANRR